MGARQDFQKAQTEIQRQKELLARGRASGNENLIKAAQANIKVLEGRATTAFQKIAREEATKRQRQAEAQRKAQARAEAQRKAQQPISIPVETAPVQAQQQAVQIPVPVETPKPAETPRQRALRIRQEASLKREQDARDLAERKRIEEERAKAVFESESIQSEPGKAFASGEEFRIETLEQRRRDVLEGIEATKAQERLEKGTTFFETGPGFEETQDPRLQAGAERKIEGQPDRPISPDEPEGVFISGTVQAQLADRLSDLVDIETQIGAIKTEIPGEPEFREREDDELAGVRALETFEQTRDIETRGLFPGSTVVLTAEEAGLAVPSKEKFEGQTFEFPAISGDIIQDVQSTREFAEQEGLDPFEVAQEEREAQGLIAGQPVTFGNLLGFDTPGRPIAPTGKAPKPTDPLQVIQQAGLPIRPADELKIETGFIPFDQPISEPLQEPKKTGKRGRLSPTTPAFIAAPTTVLPTVDSFDSFLSDLGSQFNIGGDLFKTVSTGLNFENIFGRKPLPRKTTKASKIAKAKSEIATLKRQGRTVPSTLIAQAFPDKTARAKKAGFQVSSTGTIFEGRRSKGTFTGLRGSTVAKVKAKRASIQKEAARKRAEAQRKAREVAARKRARAVRKSKKTRRTTGARRPKVVSGGSAFGGRAIPRRVSVTRPSAQRRGVKKSQIAIRSPSVKTVGQKRFERKSTAKKKKTTKKKSKPSSRGKKGRRGSGRLG